MTISLILIISILRLDRASKPASASFQPLSDWTHLPPPSLDLPICPACPPHCLSETNKSRDPGQTQKLRWRSFHFNPIVLLIVSATRTLSPPCSSSLTTESPARPRSVGVAAGGEKWSLFCVGYDDSGATCSIPRDFHQQFETCSKSNLPRPAAITSDGASAVINEIFVWSAR